MPYEDSTPAVLKYVMQDLHISRKTCAQSRAYTLREPSQELGKDSLNAKQQQDVWPRYIQRPPSASFEESVQQFPGNNRAFRQDCEAIMPFQSMFDRQTPDHFSFSYRQPVSPRKKFDPWAEKENKPQVEFRARPTADRPSYSASLLDWLTPIRGPRQTPLSFYATKNSNPPSSYLSTSADEIFPSRSSVLAERSLYRPLCPTSPPVPCHNLEATHKTAPLGYADNGTHQSKSYYSDDESLHHSPLPSMTLDIHSTEYSSNDHSAPSRYLKISNVPKDMSVWSAREASKSYGDLKIIFSFLKRDRVLFLEYFDIRHAMNAMKRLKSHAVFRSSDVTVSYCSKAFMLQVSPNTFDSDNDGCLSIKLESPQLSNDILKFLSTHGDVQSFHTNTHQWPLITLVQYYDIRHAASAMAALQSMQVNCYVSYHQNESGSSSPVGACTQLEPDMNMLFRNVSALVDSPIRAPGVGLLPKPIDASSRSLPTASSAAVSSIMRPIPEPTKLVFNSLNMNPEKGNDGAKETDQGTTNADTLESTSVESKATKESSSPTTTEAKKLKCATKNTKAAAPKNLPVKPAVPPAPSTPQAAKDTRTTFMIRNIPNKYTQQMLLECINETHFGKFDFLYLRMDFKNKCNVGYAFINFINVEEVDIFVKAHVGKKCVMDEEPSYRPKIFYTKGLNIGQEEPFPGPTCAKDGHRWVSQRRARYSA
ncbi:hypothetical protein BGZ94_005996 [Podila epigama]|nr:hypothetical protein BGZ94_005996 [Podila epigama]